MAVEGGSELPSGHGVKVGDVIAHFLVVHLVAVVTLAIGDDLILALGAAGQDVALHVGAVPGGNEAVVHGTLGNGGGVRGVVQGTGDVRVPVGKVHLTGLGIGDPHHDHLGVTELIEDVVVHAVEVLVSVGGDGDVLLAIEGLVHDSVGVKGILAQVQVADDPPGAPVDHGAAHQGHAPGGLVVHHVLAVLGLVGPVALVKDGGGSPVAVEGQHGQAQGRSGAGGVGEGDKALHIHAVFKQLVQLSLLTVGEGHSLGEAGGLSGLHGDLAQLHGLDDHVLVHHGVALAPGAVHRLGVGALEGDGHVIGHGLVGDVVHIKGDVVAASAVGVVQQLQLAHILAVHGDVGGGVHGGGGVDQAGALLTGRVVHPALIGLRHSGAHQQLVDNVAHLTGLLAGKGCAGLHVLAHQGGNTGHVRGGHGGTAHHAVAAGVALVGGVDLVDDGGPDVAAGGGDLRLQLQAGTSAPGGEGGHLAVGGILHGLVVLGNHDVHGLACLEGSLHGSAVLAVDKGAGEAGVLHADVDQFRGIGIAVIDQHAQNAPFLSVDHSGEGLGVGDLIGKGQVAALDQGKAGLAILIGVLIVPAHGVVVAPGTGALYQVDGVLLAVGEGGLHGHGPGVGVGDLPHFPVLVGPGQVGLYLDGVLQRGNAQVGVVNGRRGHHSGVHVGGQGVVPIVVAGRGVAAVASGGHEHDASGLNLGIQLVLHGVVVGKAVVRTQAQVDDIGAQGQSILQSVEGHRLLGAAVLIGEHLHHHDLGIGGHAGENDLALAGLGIARHRTGDVGAVVAGGGQDVDVAVCVVTGVGHLEVLIKTVVVPHDHAAIGTRGGVELVVLQEGSQALRGVAQIPAALGIAGVVFKGVVGEGLVDPHHAAALGAILVLGHAPLQVQAGVQHGHQHTLTGVALAPDTFHPYLIIAVGVPGLVPVHGAAGLFGPVIHQLHIGPLDPVQVANFIQSAVGHPDSHGIDQSGPLAYNGTNRLTAVFLGGIGHRRLLSGQSGDLVDDALLIVQQLLGGLLGIGGGQVLRHRLTSAGLVAHRGSVAADLVVIHHSRSFHLHDDGYHLILCISGLAVVLGVLVLHPGLGLHFLGLDRALIGLSALSPSLAGKCASQHHDGK